MCALTSRQGRQGEARRRREKGFGDGFCLGLSTRHACLRTTPPLPLHTGGRSHPCKLAQSVGVAIERSEGVAIPLVEPVRVTGIGLHHLSHRLAQVGGSERISVSIAICRWEISHCSSEL